MWLKSTRRRRSYSRNQLKTYISFNPSDRTPRQSARGRVLHPYSLSVIHPPTWWEARYRPRIYILTSRCRCSRSLTSTGWPVEWHERTEICQRSRTVRHPCPIARWSWSPYWRYPTFKVQLICRRRETCTQIGQWHRRPWQQPSRNIQSAPQKTAGTWLTIYRVS